MLLATHCNWAWGQTSNFTTNANSLASSGSLIDSFFIKKAKFVDNYNNSYTYEDLKLKQQPDSFQCSSPTGIFNLTFVNNEDIDFFEDPQVVTTICQVFSDLSGLIERRNSPCVNNGAKVEINLVEGEIYVGNSTTPDPNVAARGFTYYQWMPDSYADDGIVDKGIVDNLAWQVINTGYPPGITGMIGSGFYHGEIRFNPAIAPSWWAWNTDFAATSMPDNTVDLYSTTLHEALHVLGFDSGIDATGAASLEFTVPASTDTYKRYDMFLESGNNFLITNPNVLADPYNWNFTSNPSNLVATSGGCSIDYDYNGSAYPIHTPSTFSGGSLRHLDNDCATPVANYVMHSIVLDAIHRTPTPEEVNILCSLGYKTSQYYGTYTNGQWSHNHEFYTSCDNNMPIGITNYRPNCSSEDYTITMCQNPSSINIPFSEILGNDINVTGNTTITGINIIDVTQSQLIDVTTAVYGNYFTLTVENVGTLDVENATIWLKYVPVTPTANGTLLGNVSYINVKVVGCCFPNIPPTIVSDCNLIPNPTLAINSGDNCDLNAAVMTHNVGTYNQCVNGWARLKHWPGCIPSDILQTSIDNIGYSGNILAPTGFGCLRQVAILADQEITVTEVAVEQNKNYILSFLILGINDIDESPDPLIDYTAHLINSADIEENCDYSNAPKQQVFQLPNPVQVPFKQAVNCFTAAQNWDRLYFTPLNNEPVVSFMAHPVLVEDVDKAPFDALEGTNITTNCNDTNVELFNPTLCDDVLFIEYTVTDNNGYTATFINQAVSVPKPNCTTTYTITRRIKPWATDYPDIQQTYDLILQNEETTEMLCSTPVNVTVEVLQDCCPTVTLSAIESTICLGDVVTLSANLTGGTITITNGSEQHTQILSDGNNMTYTPTQAGTYTVSYDWTYFTCCSGTATTSFTVNALPIANISGNGNICQGQSTTLTATGGGTYEWSTSETMAAISVTTAGTYTVTVTDTNGCTATASTTVTVNTSPTANITGTTTYCVGQSATLLTASGGVSYLWNTTETTAAITPSTASIGSTIYTVTVTNAQGCTATASTTVTVNPQTIPTFDPITAICSGDVAPVLPATSSNGIAGTWLPALVSNTASGTYTFTPAAGSCTSTATINVTVNPSPTINSATATCVASLGRITVLPAGLTYNIGTGAQASNVFNNLTNGTYTVTVTNAAGCTKTATATVNCAACPVPVASSNSPVCYGSALNLSVNPYLPAGGVTATYAWSGPTSSSTLQNPTIPNMTPAKAGVYTVTVTYSNGCTATASTNAVVYPAFGVTISGSSSFCSGSNTSLSASTGYTAYNWNTGATTQAITITAGGTYTVTVTNAAGCTKTATKTVTVNPSPTASITAVCAGESSTTLTASGGSSYVWSNGISSTTINTTTAGTYTVTVTGTNGCTATASAIVNPPTIPTFAAIAPICSGAVAPVLPATSSNGIMGTWLPSTISNTASGTYTFTPNAGQCATTATLTTTVTTQTTPTFAQIPAFCSGTAAPSLPITSLNSISGTWLPSTISNTASGTYTFTPNAGQCATTATLNITVNALPIASITGTTSVCIGETTTLTASGGGTYDWSNGSTNSSINVSLAGTYTVTVTNNGCTATASITVVALSASANIIGDNMVCVNTPATLTASGGILYNWSNGLGNTATVSVNSAGTYTVTVTDANGCTDTDTHTVSNPSFLYFDTNNQVVPATYPFASPNFVAPVATTSWFPGSHPFGTIFGDAADPIRINGDVVIPAGAVIFMSDLHFEFGPNGRIVLLPQAVLSINGGVYTGDPNCKTMWQGIRARGSGGLFSSLGVNASNTTGQNARIEQALIGVLTANVPVWDIQNINTQLAALPFANQNFFADNNIGSTLFSDIWTPAAFVSGNALVNISDADFKNCFIGSAFTWNPQMLFVQNSHFYKTGSMYYPFNNAAIYPEAGIQTLFSRQINVWNSHFDDLKYGIRHNIGTWLGSDNNTFTNCNRGLSARGNSTTNNLLFARDNDFNNCLTGLQAQSVHASIRNNTVNENSNPPYGIQANGTNYPTIGFLLMGSQFDVSHNNLVNSVSRGIVVVDADIEGGIVHGNTISNTNIAEMNVGDNTGTQIECNDLLNYNITALALTPWINAAQNGILDEQGVCDFVQPENSLPAANLFAPAAGVTLPDVLALLSNFTYHEFADQVANINFGSNVTFGSCADFTPPTYDRDTRCAATEPNMPPSQIDDIADEVKKAEMVRKMLNYYIETNDSAGIADLLSQVDSYLAKRLYVQQYWQYVNNGMVDQLLTDLPNEREEDIHFKYFYNLLRDLERNGQSIFEIDQQQEAELVQIAQSRTATAYRAQALLHAARGHEFAIHLPDLNLGAGNSNWQTSFKTSNAIIKLYPNPAANNFTIETQLATTDTPLTLNLYGLDGVLVLTKQINTNTAVISTETLNAGIYVCTVMQNGNVLQREKLVITK